MAYPRSGVDEAADLQKYSRHLIIENKLAKEGPSCHKSPSGRWRRH